MSQCVPTRRFAVLLTAALLALSTASSAETLRPFTSDGCSLFPDRSPDGKVDWCVCCLAHDLSYWRGGTAAERDRADQRLRECVIEKTGNTVLASSMYLGVRMGGDSHFPTWYRWGYGWDYGRGDLGLTHEETVEADRLERAYEARGVPAACRR